MRRGTHPTPDAARTWARRVGLGIGASRAEEGMESTRVAEGIAGSGRLFGDLWQWPSQNACRAARRQEAGTDLIEPLQRVDARPAADNAVHPRGRVVGPVAAGPEVAAAGTLGKKLVARTVERVGSQHRARRRI